MRSFLLNILVFIGCCLSAQNGLFVNGADASFRVDSTSFISVNGDFQNNKCDPTRQVRFNGPMYLSGSLINNDILRFLATTGPLDSKNARVIFNYNASNPSGLNAIIGGSVMPEFWEVEIDKTLAGSLTLNNNISCSDTLTFKTGNVFMNGYKWNLKDPVGASIVNHPYLKNERNGCRFMPISINDTGLVILKSIFDFPMDMKAANIGLALTGSVNTGSDFNVKRGFVPQVNAGKGGILRYFDVHSPASIAINTIKINYNLNDLSYFSPGYFNISKLKLFVSTGGDLNWTPLPSTLQNTMVSQSVHDGLMSASLSDLSLPNINVPDTLFRITIADSNCPNPPVSALLLDTLHICAGTTLTLDAGNNSPVPNSSLRWEWNTTPLLYTQTHTVTPNGSFQKYTVKLMDARGCISIDSVVVGPAAPYPQITYFNHLNSCFGDSVTIKDTIKISSGSYANSWLFSDGSTSTTLQQYFKKKYNTLGEHSIQLTSTSNFGCSVTASATNVIVYPLPTASFTNALDCVSGLMSFTGTSVSNHTALVISGNLWNLGQGLTNTSTAISPSQTYSSSGTYTVKLVSTSSFGCKDSVSNPVIIYPANQALFTKNNSCLNDTVFITNNSACNTGSCAYQWTLGDATQSNLTNLKKVYTTPGLYSVKLKVTNPLGCPDSVSTNVFVNPNPSTQFVSTNTSVCINTALYFTNNSTIASGAIMNHSWNFGNLTTSTSINASSSYTNAGIYNVSLTTASDSGCVTTSTLPITIHPQPVAQYAVSNTCFGTASQFISTSTGPGLSYIWDFGNSVITGTTNSNLENYTYPGLGTFTTQLIAFNVWGCSDTTSLPTTIFTSPAAALGDSVSTCGTTYTLNAGNAGSSYLWQPGNQTTQSVLAVTNGIYQVSITNTNNCVGTQTVHVTLNAIVKPHLGNDSTVCGPFVLNAGYPGSIFSWNNSSTTQTILATLTNTYIVQVTDQNNCLGSDTIQLIVNTPASVQLGNDLTICKPKFGLVLTPTTNATTFLWSNGLTTSSINVTTGGNYWIEATAANGCKHKDTLNLTFLNTPQVELGNNKSACGFILLDAQNNGCSYLWNTSTTEQTLNVTTSGNYWITVTNTLNSCFQQDSVNLVIHPLVNVFLGNDTTFCSNVSFLLDANNSGSSYTWTSGQTVQSIPVTSSGLYGVTVTNTGGCSATDYITINLIGAPQIDLGNDTRYLCGNNSVEFVLTTTAQVNWGSDNNATSTTNTLNAQQPGKYWATVEDYGCSASDSVLVVATNNTIQALFLASTQDTVNKPVKFVNLSEPVPTSQLWIFGDGVTSTESHPVHTYVLPQDFSVTLEVSNGFCTDKITKQLSVLFRQSSQQIHQPKSKLELLSFNVFPNPSDNYLTINFSLNDFAPVKLRIYDIAGRLVAEDNSDMRMNYSNTLNIHEFKSGLYFLNINAQSSKGNIMKTTKFIKTN